MSKAEKLRRHRANRDSMELAPIPKRQGKTRDGNGRFSRKAEDASQIVMIGRCRRAGIDPTEEAIRDMKAMWQGCEAGRAMSRYVSGHIDPKKAEETRKRLWDAIHHIRTSWARYASLHGLPARSAQCLRIMLPVDEMHADATTPGIDPRTIEERHASALRKWREVELLVARYGRHTAGITLRCVLDDMRCEDATSMCLALRNVADHVISNANA
ncbi:hypothetical protein [Paracoccus sp. PAR01]|uniref:hypothetical protein n=1 Tax=Paracoccus sp. PAR01 TaxID=2769282 RepID=UPI00177F4E8F|nr:hypothetical protein [Paracoccus sp. PAR01]MBD9528989.1 hypothetical protein [Paracoccus sp. PAR01]